jgi:hypothetical protein
MSLQPTLLPVQQAQGQSSHPLTEQIHRRSTILEPSSSSSSMLIYDDQSDSDNSQCAQNKEPIQITEQHIKRYAQWKEKKSDTHPFLYVCLCLGKGR